MKADRRGKRSPILMLGALGIVFGDIGTSPLYAFKVALHETGGIDPGLAVLGTLSLIIWSLILIISLKYALLIMRADKQGEGGIIAMLALLGSRRSTWLTLGAIVGAALLYGDGAITPAISVLSALEGVTVSAPNLSSYTVPVAVAILIALFAVQQRGSGAIGHVVGPIMLAWFGVIGATGAIELARAPSILWSLSPLPAWRFLLNAKPALSFAVLGAVFLSVTGGEAMYADMGHFGRGPIRMAWFLIVFPALTLNYLGQGAAILLDPSTSGNPFYALAPGWAHYPMLVLATAATVIASQAIISGAFSLTQQAIRLNLLPHLRLMHTSGKEAGQIFVPVVNFLLGIATLTAVLVFRSSNALAGAYGIAVSGLMGISTLLAGLVALRWRYPLALVVIVNGGFLAIDLVFFAANSAKVLEGGWYPLALAAAVAMVMMTWRRGITLVESARAKLRQDEGRFSDDLERTDIVRLDGTAAFLSASERGIPLTLTHHIRHNRVLHQKVLLVSIVIDEEPRVPPDATLRPREIRSGMVRVPLHFGFMDIVDVPARLRAAVRSGQLSCEGIDDLTYYVGHETIIADAKTPGMATWRDRLFVALQRATAPTAVSFGIPAAQAIEIGLELKI